MPKIDVTMNSVYDSGKIRGYATAVIDDCISIRGIKLEHCGGDELDVKTSMPKRENTAIFSLFGDDFSAQLNMKVLYAYCNEIGVDMSVADPIADSSCNPKNMDVLMTKLFHNGERGTLLALSNVTIDDSFSINRVEVREVNGVLDVQMPQRKTVDGFKEICSLVNEDYQVDFTTKVLQGYFVRLEMVEASLVEESTPVLLESSEDCHSNVELAEDMEEISEESQDFGMGGMNDG